MRPGDGFPPNFPSSLKLGLIALLAAAVLPAASGGAASAVQEPRILAVLVGGGQDTDQVLAFLPSRLRVRAGDSVLWRIAGDEVHTATFSDGLQPGPDGFGDPGGVPRELLAFRVPAPPGAGADWMMSPLMQWPTRGPDAPTEAYRGVGLVSSGILSKHPNLPGEPPNDTFPVIFDTPGVYPYLCLVHVSGMMGTVEVVGSDEPVPDQAAIDAQAGAELVGQVRRLAQTRGQSDQARSQPGPAGTTTWHVNAGAGFGAIHLFEFMPRDLTVRSGDTVVWSSTYFHSITFNPTPPPPLWIVPEPQDEGPPLMLLNRLITQPSEPSGVFDPTQYFNSADLGPFSRLGASWSLTFDRPGSFEYFCAIHRDLGMVASITVVPR